MSHHLYRCFAADGTLLWIGASRSALARIDGLSAATWFSEIANVTMENFKTRAAALIAEKKAIQKENPKYNRYLQTPPVRTDPTNNERQKRYIARLKAKAAAAAEADTLKQELAAAKARIKTLASEVRNLRRGRS